MATPFKQLLSRTLYYTDGTTTVWDFSFASGYLDVAHIKAYTETPAGVRVDQTISLTGPNQVTISPALADGDILVIYRDTPKNAPLVDFTDESGFSEIALDTNAKQAVMVAAEAIDAINTTDVDAAARASALAVEAQVAADLAASAADADASAAAASAAAALLSELASAVSAADAAAYAASLNTANLVDKTTNQTITGTKTFGNRITMAVDALYSHGIFFGSGSRHIRLEVAAGHIELVNVAGTAVTHSFLDNGDFWAQGNVIAYSDERVKTNWRGFGPEFVAQLAGIKSGIYDRTDQESTQVGVSAQSLQTLLPNAVITDSEGKLSVAYGNAAMVSVIELAKEVLALKARLLALETK